MYDTASDGERDLHCLGLVIDLDKIWPLNASDTPDREPRLLLPEYWKLCVQRHYATGKLALVVECYVREQWFQSITIPFSDFSELTVNPRASACYFV